MEPTDLLWRLYSDLKNLTWQHVGAIAAVGFIIMAATGNWPRFGRRKD